MFGGCWLLQVELAEVNWYTNTGLINLSVLQWESQRPSGKECVLRLESSLLALEKLRRSNTGCYLLLEHVLGHVPWTHILPLGESANANKSKISISLRLNNFVDRTMSSEILSQNITLRGERESISLCPGLMDGFASWGFGAHWEVQPTGAVFRGEIRQSPVGTGMSRNSKWWCRVLH